MTLMSFDEIRTGALSRGRKRVAVADAADETALEALAHARQIGLVEPVAIGVPEKIREAARACGADLEGFRIVEASSPEDAAALAAKMVRDGEADICMKGNVPTSTFMRAVLDREKGLRAGRLISHVAAVWSEKRRRLLLITDGGVNIAPTLPEKAEILRNALPLARTLGSPRPRVAVMAAVEKVNEKMPATVDAARLVEMAARGELGECEVGGPFALDNAVSEEDARKKGIDHPVAGRAEILLAPDIHSGNLMSKAIMYFAECRFGGVVVGTRAPVVFLSRVDTVETRLNSIALGVLTAGQL